MIFFAAKRSVDLNFTVTADPSVLQSRLAFTQNDLGVGNRLTLLDEEIFENLNDSTLQRCAAVCFAGIR